MNMLLSSCVEEGEGLRRALTALRRRADHLELKRVGQSVGSLTLPPDYFPGGQVIDLREFEKHVDARKLPITAVIEVLKDKGVLEFMPLESDGSNLRGVLRALATKVGEVAEVMPEVDNPWEEFEPHYFARKAPSDRHAGHVDPNFEICDYATLYKRMIQLNLVTATRAAHYGCPKIEEERHYRETGVVSPKNLEYMWLDYCDPATLADVILPHFFDSESIAPNEVEAFKRATPLHVTVLKRLKTIKGLSMVYAMEIFMRDAQGDVRSELASVFGEVTRPRTKEEWRVVMKALDEYLVRPVENKGVPTIGGMREFIFGEFIDLSPEKLRRIIAICNYVQGLNFNLTETEVTYGLLRYYGFKPLIELPADVAIDLLRIEADLLWNGPVEYLPREGQEGVLTTTPSDEELEDHLKWNRDELHLIKPVPHTARKKSIDKKNPDEISVEDLRVRRYGFEDLDIGPGKTKYFLPLFELDGFPTGIMRAIERLGLEGFASLPQGMRYNICRTNSEYLEELDEFLEKCEEHLE